MRFTKQILVATFILAVSTSGNGFPVEEGELQQQQQDIAVQQQDITSGGVPSTQMFQDPMIDDVAILTNQAESNSIQLPQLEQNVTTQDIPSPDIVDAPANSTKETQVMGEEDASADSIAIKNELDQQVQAAGILDVFCSTRFRVMGLCSDTPPPPNVVVPSPPGTIPRAGMVPMNPAPGRPINQPVPTIPGTVIPVTGPAPNMVPRVPILGGVPMMGPIGGIPPVNSPMYAAWYRQFVAQYLAMRSGFATPIIRPPMVPGPIAPIGPVRPMVPPVNPMIIAQRNRQRTITIVLISVLCGVGALGLGAVAWLVYKSKKRQSMASSTSSITNYNGEYDNRTSYNDYNDKTMSYNGGEETTLPSPTSFRDTRITTSPGRTYRESIIEEREETTTTTTTKNKGKERESEDPYAVV